jgi:hypothetical protein
LDDLRQDDDPGLHFPRPGRGKIARDGAGYALTAHTA